MHTETLINAIPDNMPSGTKLAIIQSIDWLREMEDREEGDPRQIEATKHSLMATIELWNAIAPTRVRRHTKRAMTNWND